jgi:hypothetical protein
MRLTRTEKSPIIVMIRRQLRNKYAVPARPANTSVSTSTIGTGSCDFFLFFGLSNSACLPTGWVTGVAIENKTHVRTNYTAVGQLPLCDAGSPIYLEG